MSNTFVSCVDMVAHIRDWLGNPAHDQLSQETVLMRLQRKLDHYRNRQDLSDQNWLLSKWVLTVDTSHEDYAVTAAAFGRPTQAYTIDPSNPNHVRRYIRIISKQEMELHYTGPVKSVEGSFPSPWIARAMAFYRDFTTAQTMVQVLPIHNQACSYLVEYQPSRVLPLSMSDNLGMLDNYACLFEVDTALDCLIELKIPDEEYKRRQMLLLQNKAEQQKSFEQYVADDKTEKVVRRRCFGDGIDDQMRGLPYSW